MPYLNKNDKIEDIVILLVFYSMFFAYKVNDVGGIILNNANKSIILYHTEYNNVSSYDAINNIMLIIVPVLIYLSIKSNFYLIKLTYIIACMPFILHFMFYFKLFSLKFMNIANCILSFIIVVLLIKCIRLMFQIYNNK